MKSTIYNNISELPATFREGRLYIRKDQNFIVLCTNSETQGSPECIDATVLHSGTSPYSNGAHTCGLGKGWFVPFHGKLILEED